MDFRNALDCFRMVVGRFCDDVQEGRGGVRGLACRLVRDAALATESLGRGDASGWVSCSGGDERCVCVCAVFVRKREGSG